ncbi:tetratricopeptide repeat protein [uncultured Devosia sp.]|uniref:tetratricopeptide repeat protein n=1 Tax=uncultured Devosia sp. TaxID=211434 RepID=UPI002631D352|nr:tetratricopeptide repeat protein [uncultured Devosia sp.]
MKALLRLVLTAMLLAAAPTAPGLAQPFGQSAEQATRLEILFSRLSAATDAEAARAIADEIWQIWIHPDDPELDARVTEIMTSGGFAGPASQIPLIDALIADYPDYAEGWNMRATAHFLNGAYDKSLADIVETLAREPRHFGAMAGRALIYYTQGKRDEALEAIRAALDIHPFLPERMLFPELGDPPIRS